MIKTNVTFAQTYAGSKADQEEHTTKYYNNKVKPKSSPLCNGPSRLPRISFPPLKNRPPSANLPGPKILLPPWPLDGKILQRLAWIRYHRHTYSCINNVRACHWTRHYHLATLIAEHY